jgi:hypothetical protein
MYSHQAGGFNHVWFYPWLQCTPSCDTALVHSFL